jgi:hypothetical protein
LGKGENMSLKWKAAQLRHQEEYTMTKQAKHTPGQEPIEERFRLLRDAVAGRGWNESSALIDEIEGVTRDLRAALVEADCTLTVMAAAELGRERAPSAAMRDLILTIRAAIATVTGAK